MSSIEILGYDYTNTEFRLRLKNAGITVKDSIDNLLGSKIAIVHPPSDEAWTALIAKSPKGSVRIRTSSVGRSGYEHNVTERGVIELNLQLRHLDVTSQEWKDLLEEVKKTGIAQGIVTGSVPAELDRYFGTVEPVHLTALAILCQGYLAVMNPGFLGKAEGFFPTTETRERAKAQVLSPKYWINVFTPKGQAEPLLNDAILDKEWPLVNDPSIKKHRDAVISLILNIQRKQTPNTATVESAFNAIQARWDYLDKHGRDDGIR